MFAGKAVHISVEAVNEDETDYLMRSKTNYLELVDRIKYVEQGGELIPVNLADWQ